MIEVYSGPTPNGHRVRIMLEECVVPYRVIPVDIGSGAQFAHGFLAISPNNKVPALIDPDGPDGEPNPPFESGAILLYLAGKAGRLLPADTRGRYERLAGVREPLTDDRAREVLFGATQHARH
jgi:GST-like protein